MINCIVIGAAGRMGTRIIHAIHNTKGFKLVGAVESAGHPQTGWDAGELSGVGKMDIPITDRLETLDRDFDVLIDFTTPDSSLNSLAYAAGKKQAAVIGTTGFTKLQTERIRTLAENCPCVVAPNMSVGINLMFHIISQLARVLKDDYDMEIIESHHRLKKDAPSGTAVKMAQILANTLDRDLDRVAVHQRKGLIGERSREEIGIQVIRAGDIVGEHTLLLAGQGERLEVTHRAHSRDTFARGALKAAQWVVGQKPGLYDMEDVLGLKQYLA